MLQTWCHISHCLWLVTPVKYCVSFHQADLLRAILPVNTQDIVSRFKLAQKDQEGLQNKTNTFLLFFTISFRTKTQKSHTEIGSSLYCISWRVHSPTQKHSLRRFVLFNCPLCSNTIYKWHGENWSRKWAELSLLSVWFIHYDLTMYPPFTVSDQLSIEV